MRVKQATLVVASSTIAALSCWQATICQTNQEQAPKPIIIKPTSYTPRKPDAESERGKKYYQDHHCSDCHSIGNEGGQVGPVLDGVGARRDGEYLRARLSMDGSAIKKFAQMTNQSVADLPPHPRLSSMIARALIAYLQTLPEPAGGFVVTPHASRPASSAPDTPAVTKPAPLSASAVIGQKLFDKYGCAQCHSIRGAGGMLGPSLDGIGMLHSAAYIGAHINNAQVVAEQNSTISSLVPTPMPKFQLSKHEVDAITDYLLTLPQYH